jgi:3-deoxy-7-phosphoheptulonate synthase
VEYFRNIANPIGVKVGPSMKPDELVELIKVLNPDNVIGKITLITRYSSSSHAHGHTLLHRPDPDLVCRLGAEQVRKYLPDLVTAVSGAGLRVIWSCDPMHGNTKLTKDGIKTRNFDVILKELTVTFEVHSECNSRLGGVHFELTGEYVTECTGGPQQIQDEDLHQRYTTYCDPRLNYTQSMEVRNACTHPLPHRHVMAASHHSSSDVAAACPIAEEAHLRR